MKTELRKQKPVSSMLLVLLIGLFAGCSSPNGPDELAKYGDINAIKTPPAGYVPGFFPSGATWEYVIDANHKLWFLRDEGMIWTRTDSISTKLYVDSATILLYGNEIWFSFAGFYFHGIHTGGELRGYRWYNGEFGRVTLKPRVI